MKILDIVPRSLSMTKLFRTARRKDVVLESPDGEAFLLTFVDDFDYELAQQRGNKRLMTFLHESFRRARQEKRIPWEQVKRECGLDRVFRNGAKRETVKCQEPVTKVVKISRRSRALLKLLNEVKVEDLILSTPNGREYALTAMKGDKVNEAKNRLSEIVMAHTDELVKQGKLQPLGIVFVSERSKWHRRPKRAIHDRK